MKKIRNVILCTVIILSLFLSSCSDVDSYNGDVAYEVVSAEDGTAWINGLSPAGREKTSVWLPSYIDGYRIVRVSRYRPLPIDDTNLGSERLERIYFPYSYVARSEVHWNTPRLKYVFVTGEGYVSYIPSYATVVLPLPAYEGNNYRMNTTAPANVAFMFNYPDAANGGYYAIDLLEETGVLTAPPYEPTRDGYSFAGWYADAECTVTWSFDEPVEISVDDSGTPIYREHRLYAKWNENNGY